MYCAKHCAVVEGGMMETGNVLYHVALGVMIGLLALVVAERPIFALFDWMESMFDHVWDKLSGGRW